MVLAALRDLQWRRRRFLITAVGTALVFAMSLLLSGLAEAFQNEGRSWIHSLGADLLVVEAGQSGPLTGFAPIDAARVDDVAAVAGVRDASGFLKAVATVDLDGITDINVFGAERDGLGWPDVHEGTLPLGDGQAVVDDSLGLEVGDQVRLVGATVTISGTTSGSTLNGGLANVYLPLADAQRLFLRGLPAVTIVLVQGRPAASLPTGLTGYDREQALDDLLRPFGAGVRSINFIRILLWTVAACIIGSIVYLTALERTWDFAVFKAVGTSAASIGGGLALQAVILALVSALLAAVLGNLLSPLFPLPVHIPRRAFLALPVVAVVVGLVASLVGLRRAVKVPPSVAFGAR
jgi:putative ABC transport system permease protein